MEDCNALAADCIIVSCCCQCLILQVVVLILLKLPYRLIRKVKEIISRIRIKYSKKRARGVDTLSFPCDDLVPPTPGFSIGISDHENYECCMQEIEMVLEDLSKKGEFAFGSFWGRELGGGSSPSRQELDINLVQLEVDGNAETSSIHSIHSTGARRLVIYA